MEKIPASRFITRLTGIHYFACQILCFEEKFRFDIQLPYILLISRISSFIRSTTVSGPIIFTPSPKAMIQPRNWVLTATTTEVRKCSASTGFIGISLPNRSIRIPTIPFLASSVTVTSSPPYMPKRLFV